jgi:hypothetical protein
MQLQQALKNKRFFKVITGLLLCLFLLILKYDVWLYGTQGEQLKSSIIIGLVVFGMLEIAEQAPLFLLAIERWYEEGDQEEEDRKESYEIYGK